MDCSIIIVNYNTGALVVQAIDALKSTIHNIEYEVVVVDNNSTEDISIINTAHPDVNVLKLDENIGFGRANNAGAEKSRGENIFFLNPDTIVRDGAVEALDNYLKRNDKAGACGANLFSSDNKPAHSFKRITPSIFSEINDALGGMPVKLIYGRNSDFNNTGKPLEVAYICGADLMVKRSVFNMAGGFDKDIFMYYEDSLLCSRITSLGYTVMSVPQAEIVHLEGRSFNLNTSREQRVFDGRRVFFEKRYSERYVRCANMLNKCLLAIAAGVYKILGKRELAEKYKFRLSLYNKER